MLAGTLAAGTLAAGTLAPHACRRARSCGLPGRSRLAWEDRPSTRVRSLCTTLLHPPDSSPFSPQDHGLAACLHDLVSKNFHHGTAPTFGPPRSCLLRRRTITYGGMTVPIFPFQTGRAPARPQMRARVGRMERIFSSSQLQLMLLYGLVV